MIYIHIVQFHLMSGGGVGSVITDISEAMVKNNFNVYIVSLFRSEPENMIREKKWAEENNIKIFTIQNIGMNKVSVLIALREKIKELAKNDDICLYLHLKWGVLAGVISSFGLKNVRRIEVYHSGYKNYRLQSFLCKPLIHHYIAVSNEARDQLINWFGVENNKIEVIYNGVDIDYIHEIIKNLKDVHKSKSISFLSVGRLSFEKGFKTSITSYAKLKSENKLVDSQYTIIGDGPDINEDIDISKGYVNFSGCMERNKIFSKIFYSDIIIMPSLWEGNSIFLLEVLAIGKPIILTDIPSYKEVFLFDDLKDSELFRIEKFGALCRKENIDSFCGALMSLENNNALFKNMAKYVNSFASNYSIDKQMRKYIEVSKI